MSNASEKCTKLTDAELEQVTGGTPPEEGVKLEGAAMLGADVKDLTTAVD